MKSPEWIRINNRYMHINLQSPVKRWALFYVKGI